MSDLKNMLLILFLIISVSGSCKRESTKDLSLNTEAYGKLGMPDHSKIWTNDDYANANITLSSLRINYPLSLPRKLSKKSGALFGRFINEENLSFVNDTTFPLRIRAYQIQSFERLQSEQEQIYSFEVNEKKYYNEELIDLKIFGLFGHEKMLELAWAIMDSDDEYDRGMQSGMQTVKNNYLKLIARLLDELLKFKDYPANSLERLSDKVSVSIIRNKEWFLPADRKTIISQIEAAIEKSPSDHIKNNLVETLEILNDSIN
jgi:hypothetical protein